MLPTDETKVLKGRKVDAPLEFAAPAAQAVSGAHPLEHRVCNWDQAQQDAKFDAYRRNFGAAEPIRRTMELKIVDHNPSPFQSGNLHADILRNKDAHIDWEDVYTDPAPTDIRSELARSNYVNI